MSMFKHFLSTIAVLFTNQLKKKIIYKLTPNTTV